MAVTLDVYFDFACPYCFLGEYPLERALYGRQVTVVHRPFELRPYPEPTLDPAGADLEETWKQSVYPLARGLRVPIKRPPVQPYTHLAFEGLIFAQERLVEPAYRHRVYAAFFQEGLDIGKLEVLAGLASEIGLSKQEFLEDVGSRRYWPAHRAALRHAYDEARVTRVPTFVVGGRQLIGMQSTEALAKALDAAEAAAAPVVPPEESAQGEGI